MTTRQGGSVDWLAILRESFHVWIERDAFTYSAALAFFALFSLGPVLVVFTEGAALLFDPSAVRHQIIGQFELLMGHDPAVAVDAMLGRAAVEMHGIVARIIAIATFVIGTTAVFVQLQDSLNRMWDVAPKPGPMLKNLLWKRVVSFALLLALGFVLVVSLVLSTTLHALQGWAERHATFPTAVFDTGNAVVSWLLVTVLFALLYRVLPDVEIPWRDVWAGALLTALLLSVGK
jgi:membrane protein